MPSQRATAIVDVHVLLERDHKIALLHRCNTGYCDGSYCFVAGHLEPNETVIQAAVREANEEVGIKLNAEDLRLIHVMHNNSGGHRIGFFFQAQRWTGDVVNREPYKCDSIDWFAKESLPNNFISYQRSALLAIARGEFFSSFGW